MCYNAYVAFLFGGISDGDNANVYTLPICREHKF